MTPAVDPRTLPSRIGLIRQGDKPRLNATLASMLADTFPDDDIDDIDVLGEVRNDVVRYGAAVITGGVEYIRPLVRRRMRPKRAVVRSSGFARAAGAIVADRIDPATHRFSFQSQSLYPVAVDGVANFVYTDHAHLCNLSYPGHDVEDVMTGRFLRAEAEVYRSAAMVFTRSEHVRDAVVHGYGCPPAKVAVVGVGPNTPALTANRTVERTWHGGVISFVGVDWQRKGGPQLLEAFALVRKRFPDATLHVIGCDAEDVTAGGQLTGGVEAHGRLSLDHVSRILGASDVFCLPTLAEPFGVAFIEAMLAGLPVVATRIGATPDFVIPGSTGTLVEPFEIGALASALGDMLADREATMRMGREARRLAEERYQWNVVMQKIRTHVEQFLDADEGRSGQDESA